MKRQLNEMQLESSRSNASNFFNQDGIPYKLLVELKEDSRIYKHLVTVAVVANLAIASMVVSFVNL